MRDPFPAWSEKNSRHSHRISREALSKGKGRGPALSCHHSKTPPDVSVRSTGTCFPCTASAFTPRIDSHYRDTWESPVGKPRGKDSRESHRSLGPCKGNRDTAATAWEEMARSCPHSRRGLTPLWRLQKYPKIHVSTGEESSASGPDSTQGEHLLKLGNIQEPLRSRRHEAHFC